MEFFQIIRRLSHKKATVAVLGIFAAFLAYHALRIGYRTANVRSERISLEYRAKEIINENKKIQEEINYMREDAAIERAAKEELNLRRPDEEVVVVVLPADAERPSAIAPSSWWRRTWNYLFSWR